MHLLDFLDYKTLLVCECVLAIVFTFVILWLKHVFPQVRGTYPVALSFALMVPATIFMALDGQVSPAISLLMADALALGSMIAMYEGVLQFTGGPNRQWLLWLLAMSAFSVAYYNTEVTPNVARCIVAVAVVIAIIQLSMAQALLRGSTRLRQRKTLRLFGVLLAILACISLRVAWHLYQSGLPMGMAEINAQQTIMRASGIFYLASAGLYFLTISGRELAMRQRGEVHRDRVTGAVSRTGLDVNLAVEMDRCNESGQIFSIAQVQIDSLGRILQDEGQTGVNATLREVALAIGGQLRGTDVIGRFSGDLLLLILSQTGHEEALVVAERVSAEVRRLKLLTNAAPITLSIGITESAPNDSIAQMVERAERALSLAREDGENCARVELAPEAEMSGADSAASSVV